jgi:hypothetical protein
MGLNRIKCHLNAKGWLTAVYHLGKHWCIIVLYLLFGTFMVCELSFTIQTLCLLVVYSLCHKGNNRVLVVSASGKKRETSF